MIDQGIQGKKKDWFYKLSGHRATGNDGLRQFFLPGGQVPDEEKFMQQYQDLCKDKI